jgi:hypothetical protein
VHLTPTTVNGKIPEVDAIQTKLFLELLLNKRVMPWLGGVTGKSAFLGSIAWRKNFVSSVNKLLEQYPSFAGIHLDFEPLENHDIGFLELLSELRIAIGKSKLISVATPIPRVGLWGWDKNMFEKVSKISDQIVPMLYDSHIPLQKPYVALMSSWTWEILHWSNGKDVLLGVPAWDEATASHHPEIENLENALHGIHGALKPKIPKNYAGIALYAHFTMDNSRWKTLELEFTHQP